MLTLINQDTGESMELKPFQTIEIPQKPANPACEQCNGLGHHHGLKCICTADFDNQIVINH